MKPVAIVYTSNTGHTARYAALLQEETSLPAYTLDEAKKELKKGTPVIYLGWLFASTIKGYQKAAKQYTICAVCGVGLCTTGALLEEVRKAAKVPENQPLFTVQGGMDYAKLRGLNKFMIDILMKGMSSKSQRTEGEEEMLNLLRTGGDYVSREHLTDVLAWYHSSFVTQ